MSFIPDIKEIKVIIREAITCAKLRSCLKVNIDFENKDEKILIEEIRGKAPELASALENLESEYEKWLDFHEPNEQSSAADNGSSSIAHEQHSSVVHELEIARTKFLKELQVA